MGIGRPIIRFIALLLALPLLLVSCDSQEGEAVKTPGKSIEASDAGKMSVTKGDFAANDDAATLPPSTDGVGQIVLKDRFGFHFYLDPLNQSAAYDIYEGESTDPAGNRYAAVGIHHRKGGMLSLSSFMSDDVPYHSNLAKTSTTTYSGLEQLLSEPWEHYANTYQILEGSFE